MENIVLTIGGLIKNLNFSDLFFFSSILILILLLIYIVYLIRTDDSDSGLNVKMVDPTKKKSDKLEDIITNLEENYEPKPIDLSKYEQEMEDTAIISYDELIGRASNDIAYDDNYDSGLDDVVVKKIDDSNMSTTREMVGLPEAVMMSYESEEAFLNALKTLQSNLVR